MIEAILYRTVVVTFNLYRRMFTYELTKLEANFALHILSKTNQKCNVKLYSSLKLVALGVKKLDEANTPCTRHLSSEWRVQQYATTLTYRIYDVYFDNYPILKGKFFKTRDENRYETE